MTMMYRTVHEAIVSILGDSESGRYRTVGYQKKDESAESIKHSDRTVTVFYDEGDFSGSVRGPARHDCTFIIEMAVSKPAGGDYAVLNDPESTDQQRAVALAVMTDFQYEADQSLDDLSELVYQILMDNRNIDLRLEKSITHKKRWITKYKKLEPAVIGDLAVHVARMTLTCSVQETFTGDEGIAGEAVSVTLKVNDEPTDGQAGASNE